MTLTAADIQTLRAMMKEESGKEQLEKLAREQHTATTQLTDLVKALTTSVTTLKEDVMKLKADYEAKVAELDVKFSALASQVSAASAASSSAGPQPAWTSNKRSCSADRAPRPHFEATLNDSGNENRVWVFGFQRGFTPAFYFDIGNHLLHKAFNDPVAIEQCKVRAFAVKKRLLHRLPKCRNGQGLHQEGQRPHAPL